MKFHRLTFIASVFLTLVMLFFAVLFDYSRDHSERLNLNFLYSLGFASFTILIINYLVIDFLFNFYGKKQIRRISTILPDELTHEEKNITFRELGEKVSEMSQKNADEIDMMKEMENYRKEYIGNISHELKTPLFSIQGYVETLRDGGVENLNIRDKYLERIDISVERLLNIVKDLDMINQYESGEINLNITKFDLNLLVKEMFDLLDLEASKKGAKLIIQATQNQTFVLADKQKISQVLINLISNAIYYSNREKANIIVKINPLKNKIYIQVHDNGMGIKPEALPRIFERFYRVESSRNRRDGGSGLGLAIVKHILEAHNENISVKSQYLEGTTFTFTLPAVL